MSFELEKSDSDSNRTYSPGADAAEDAARELMRTIVSERQPAAIDVSDLCESVRRRTKASGAAIAIRDVERFVCRASSGDAPEVGVALDLHRGVCAECVRTATTVVRQSLAGAIQSVIAVPVSVEHTVQGTVAVFSTEASAFSLQHVQFVQETAAQVLQRLTGIDTEADELSRALQSSNAPASGPSLSGDDTLTTVLSEVASLLEVPKSRPAPSAAASAPAPAVMSAMSAATAPAPAKVAEPAPAQTATPAPPPSVAPAKVEKAEPTPAKRPKPQWKPAPPPPQAKAAPVNPPQTLLEAAEALKATRGEQDDIVPIAVAISPDVIRATSRSTSVDTSFTDFDSTANPPKSRRMLWIAAGVLGVAALGASAVPLLRNSKTTQAPAATSTPAPAPAAADTQPQPTSFSQTVNSQAQSTPQPPVTTEKKPAEATPTPKPRTAIEVAAGTKLPGRQNEIADASAPTIALGASNLNNVLAAEANAPIPKLNAPVAQAIEPPRLLSRVDPVYPPSVLAMKLSGDIVLAVTVLPDGRVGDVRVKSGHPQLISNAVAAVRKWRYSALSSSAPQRDRLIELTLRVRGGK